jgi:hypothetical protein
MIRMKCPTCTRTVGIDEAYVGKLALCPGCHATFTVPAPAVLLEEPEAEREPEPEPEREPEPPPPPGPEPSAEILLPDGHIPLAPDGLDEEPWVLTDSHLQDVGAHGHAPDNSLASSLDLGPAPAGGSAPGGLGLLPPGSAPGPKLPPPGEQVNNWGFLSLDEGPAPGQSPGARAPSDEPLPLAPEPPPAQKAEAPLEKTADWELPSLPLPPEPEEEEPFVPVLDEPAGPLKAELVEDDELEGVNPEDIPEATLAPAPAPPKQPPLPAAKPVAAPAAPAVVIPLVAEPVTVEPVPVRPVTGEPGKGQPGKEEPITITAADVIRMPGTPAPAAPRPKEDDQGRPPTPPPPRSGGAARTPTAATTAWKPDEDGTERESPDHKQELRRPGRPKRTYGAVTLIPGVDDYYVAMAGLAVLGGLLGLLVYLWPDLSLVPIVLGGMFWVGATLWLRTALEEADPIWKWLVFIPFIAAFFAISYRDRALRAFIASVAGLLIAGMGWAAMAYAAPGEGRQDNKAEARVLDG